MAEPPMIQTTVGPLDWPVSDLEKSEPVTNKRKADDEQKQDESTNGGSVAAYLHSFGNNDFGQLGIGNTNQEIKFPYLNPKFMLKKFTQVACGGMHTLALERNGQLWSFGVNDDKALGRPAKTDEEESTPGLVNLPGQVKVIQVTGGDSHSAALTEDGAVYAWGCFKDNNGNYGLVPDPGLICRENPINITENLAVKIKKIASGVHHLAMLGEDGNLYTCGTGTHGELGRIFREARRMTRSASRTGTGTASKEFLLRPTVVPVPRSPKFTDIWTGEYSTYAMANNKSKDIYVCGLNNFGQLGIHPQWNMPQNAILVPTKMTNFKGMTWKQIAAGQGHVVGLNTEGKVYTLGMNSCGCLGRDDNSKHQDVPRLVPGLADKKCVHVAAGSRVSYAVTEAGELFAWGAGHNLQLATGDEKDRNTPSLCLENDDKPIRGPVVNVEAGGQHVALTIKLSQMACTRKKYLTMNLAEKRKEYDCKDNYVQLNAVQSWKDYFRQNNVTVATFAGDNTRPLVRDDLNQKVSIWQGDITTLEIDAIVNAAKKSLLGGGGVDGAIHKAAGRGLYQECGHLNGCEEGHAKISGGYRLPAKYVIHTVGPQGEKPDSLRACYENSLKLMMEKNLRSIAFCCISTGIYGYPNDKAADVALLTVRKFLDKKENSKKIDRVIFTVFGEKDKELYEELMQKYFPLQ